MSPSDLPLLRRIVTSHDPKGISKIESDDQVISEVSLLRSQACNNTQVV